MRVTQTVVDRILADIAEYARKELTGREFGTVNVKIVIHQGLPRLYHWTEEIKNYALDDVPCDGVDS